MTPPRRSLPRAVRLYRIECWRRKKRIRARIADAKAEYDAHMAQRKTNPRGGRKKSATPRVRDYSAGRLCACGKPTTGFRCRACWVADPNRKLDFKPRTHGTKTITHRGASA